jgi:hypothetical protein
MQRMSGLLPLVPRREAFFLEDGQAAGFALFACQQREE